MVILQQKNGGKLLIQCSKLFDTRMNGEWWATMEEIQHFDGNIKSNEFSERHAYSVSIKDTFEKNDIKMFSNFNERLFQFYTDANIQNHNVYLKDSRVYVYFEYAGDDFKKDYQ